MGRKRFKIHEPYMTFKGWLRENSLKYSDIADLLECTIGTISDKVNGLSDFQMCEVDKIVNTYGVSYEIFLSRKLRKRN